MGEDLVEIDLFFLDVLVPRSFNSRLSHCSTEIRVDLATAFTSTGVGEQGPIWGQRVLIWAPIFFYF
jgi:hypothetical protein